MTGNESAFAYGALGASYVIASIIVLVLLVLLIVARWKIFTKAGEAGWKSIIPIYSDYIQWKIAWQKTSVFWIMLALSIVGIIVMAAGGAITTGPRGQIVTTGSMGFVGVIGFIMILAAAILNFVAGYKLFTSFGHGVGWFILYILFPHIMLLVLAFGSSEYQGRRE